MTDEPDWSALFRAVGTGDGMGFEPEPDDECEHDCAYGVDRAPCDEAKVWRCAECGLLFRMVPRDAQHPMLVDVIEVEDVGQYDDDEGDAFDLFAPSPVGYAQTVETKGDVL